MSNKKEELSQVNGLIIKTNRTENYIIGGLHTKESVLLEVKKLDKEIIQEVYIARTGEELENITQYIVRNL